MKKLLLLALTLPLLLGSCNQAALRGCEDFYRVPDFARLEAELQAAQTKWTAANIQNYTYTFQYTGFVYDAQPHPAVIRNGQVDTANSDPQAKTMEQQFQYIQQAIATAKDPQSCDQLSVSYDTNDGHLLEYAWSNVKKGLQDAMGGLAIKSFQRD